MENTTGKRAKFCPKCGAELAPNMKFCNHCGFDLRQVAAAPTPTVAPSPAPAPTPLSAEPTHHTAMHLGQGAVLLLIAFGIWWFTAKPWQAQGFNSADKVFEYSLAHDSNIQHMRNVGQAAEQYGSGDVDHSADAYSVLLNTKTDNYVFQVGGKNVYIVRIYNNWNDRYWEQATAIQKDDADTITHQSLSTATIESIDKHAKVAASWSDDDLTD